MTAAAQLHRYPRPCNPAIAPPPPLPTHPLSPSSTPGRSTLHRQPHRLHQHPGTQHPSCHPHRARTAARAARPAEIAVFCSYAHTDEGLRNNLVHHLRLLEHQGGIQQWLRRLTPPQVLKCLYSKGSRIYLHFFARISV